MNSIFGVTEKSGGLLQLVSKTNAAPHTIRQRNRVEREKLRNRILNISSEDFDQLALDVYTYQYTHNSLYRAFCEALRKVPGNITAIQDIPFLPIRFFKSHPVSSNAQTPEIVFTSSTTTGQIPSRHAVCDLEWYAQIAAMCFESVFGESHDKYLWHALLPGYLERSGSSLVHMVNRFMQKVDDVPDHQSRFYLNDFDTLKQALKSSEHRGIQSILIGVTFALLDFATTWWSDIQYGRDHTDTAWQLKNTIVVETGGMKGRGPELTREAVHAKLRTGFGVEHIYSEYGMTELLSQAWSKQDGLFQAGPTLKILIRDISDPFQFVSGRRGGINCIDLGNLDSCAFIATDDVGIMHENGMFEVLGRLDTSEMRGCNLMVTNA